jgi:hypothetical protein
MAVAAAAFDEPRLTRLAGYLLIFNHCPFGHGS